MEVSFEGQDTLLRDAVKLKPGYTWEQEELKRTLRSYRQYYLLPESKKQAKETRARDAATAKRLIKYAKETCRTWDDFKAYLLQHKTRSHLNDATKLYQEFDYHPGLFHTLHLL